MQVYAYIRSTDSILGASVGYYSYTYSDGNTLQILYCELHVMIILIGAWDGYQTNTAYRSTCMNSIHKTGLHKLLCDFLITIRND